MKKWYILKGIKIVLFVAAAILVFGLIVMSLWNWLVPLLFNGPAITWWQAIGLLVLSKILFGGMRGKGHWGYRGGWYWRKRMEEKMAAMTPEEREKFREQCYGYMGWQRWGRKEEGAEPSGTN